MRSMVFAAISGALGLAALAVAAPAASYGGPDSCDLSASTVFVTVSEATTVTVHDSPTSYITVGLSEIPTITSTRLETLYSSTTTYLTPQTETVYLSLASSSTPLPSESTVFETTLVTVTDVTLTETQKAATSSGGSVTSSDTSTSNGLLSFIVENGTTYWLNGQTPPPTQSYVVETSVVIVMPVNTPAKLPDTESSTVTVHSTVIYTVPFTITETLSASNATSNMTNTLSASSFGTASSWAGWNATSSAAGVASTGAYDQLTSISGAKFNPYSSVSFITEESTYDIYHATSTIYTLPTYAAKSGFNALTSGPLDSSSQPASTSDTETSSYGLASVSSGSSTVTSEISSTSSAIGQWTTAVINGQTVSWGGPANAATSAYPSSSSSIVLPYANSTAYTMLGSAISSILGIDTTCTEEQSKTLSPSASNVTSSVTLFLTASQTSSALAIQTSSQQPSQTPSPSVGNATSSLLSSTSSTLGLDTTFSYKPTQTGSPIVSNSTSSFAVSTESAIGTDTTSSSLLTSTSSVSSVDTTCTDEPQRTSSASESSLSSPASSSGSALGAVTSSSPVLSSSIPASASQASTSTDVGNITTSPSIQPIATLPTSYTPTSSSSVITTLQSTLLSFSTVVVSSPLSSSSSVPSFSITSPAYTPSTSVSQTATVYSSAVPSLCGEQGDFTLNFDDIPPLAVSNQSANSVDPEPVFSPYHQFDFSDGFVVVPPPTDPYKPSSPPLMTEFIPNFNLTTSTTQSGPNSAEYGWSGDIGNADHGALGCFSFNVYGASFGCDSTGPDCVFAFTGFKYDNQTGLPDTVISTTCAIPACPALANCDLVPITLESGFQNLDVLRINVTVAGQPKIWWMDDLRMGWADNSCSQGLCRQNSHIRAVKHL